MAKNFKRVQREVLYRHLGNDLYHAGFLTLEREVHGRSAVWTIQIWGFALPGLGWAPLFGPKLKVVSPHLVRDIATGSVTYKGKEEVRNELLIRASQRAKGGMLMPGFSRLWSSRARGTVSAVVIQLAGMSKRLEEVDAAAPDWSCAEKEGTRCPDCGNTVCGRDCRGMN